MADVLPTLTQILDGVAAKTYTPAQAKAWVEQHIEIYVDAAADLDSFAALAMQPMLADKQFLQRALNAGRDPYECVAEAAYLQARAMKTARSA